MKAEKLILLICALMGVFSTYSWLGLQPEQGFKIGVDYLAWKAQQDLLQYAEFIPGGVPLDGSVPSRVDFSIVDQCFSWDSGVRLQAGYTFCNDWEAIFRWTHFKQNSCSSISSDSPTGIIATALSSLFNNGVLNFTQQASGRWNFCFDTFHILAGKYHCPWECVTLESLMGVEVARINQRQFINYGTVTPQSGAPFIGTVTRCNNFTGVGPFIGAEISWHMSSQWSLFGSAEGALFVGRFCTVSLTSMGDSMPSTIGSNNSKCRLRPAFDMQVGLSWHRSSWCDRFMFQIRAAVEAQYWLNQWQNFSSPLTTVIGNLGTGGDLSLWGATVGLDILF